MPRVLIILFDTLANFGGSDTNDRVRVCVIVGGPVEDFHAQDALFELVGLPARTRATTNLKKLGYRLLEWNRGEASSFSSCC